MVLSWDRSVIRLTKSRMSPWLGEENQLQQSHFPTLWGAGGCQGEYAMDSCFLQVRETFQQRYPSVVLEGCSLVLVISLFRNVQFNSSVN